MEPLFDIRGRTLGISNASLDVTLDALFRMNADSKKWRDPITLYIGTFDNRSSALGATETLALCGVIQSLRSSVATVGMGFLNFHQTLVLAAGHPTLRFLLPRTLLCVGFDQSENLRLPGGAVGLSSHNDPPSLRNQARDLIHAEIRQLVRDLGMNFELWNTPRVLTAAQAMSAGIADSIVPTVSHQHEMLLPELNNSHATER